MSFKNECKEYYKTYKESCKIIYSDIKCNTNKVIQNMTITQLHEKDAMNIENYIVIIALIKT
jgi:hypothetical protein